MKYSVSISFTLGKIYTVDLIYIARDCVRNVIYCFSVFFVKMVTFTWKFHRYSDVIFVHVGVRDHKAQAVNLV